MSRFFSEDERAELAAKWSCMTEQDLRIEYCRLEGEWFVADLKVSKILYKMNAIRLLLQHGRAKEKP